MKSQGDKQEHVTLILGSTSAPRKLGLMGSKLGSAGWGGAGPQSGVFGQGQKCGGPAELTPGGRGGTHAQPQCHKPGSRKSGSIWNGYQGDTEAALAGTQLHLCTSRCKLKSKTDIKDIFI